MSVSICIREHDDQRLGRPELVEEPEDGAPGGVVCRVEPQVEVPCDGLHELSTIDGAAPLCRHNVEGLRVRPRVREQICLPPAPPTGDQRETWARTIKELAQLRPLMLAIHEEWQKPNTIRSVYRFSSTVRKHYTAQDASRHRSHAVSRYWMLFTCSKCAVERAMASVAVGESLHEGGHGYRRNVTGHGPGGIAAMHHVRGLGLERRDGRMEPR